MPAQRRPSFARMAYLQQTLAFFDGPQVVLMKSDRGFPMVAVAVGDPTETFYPMFVTEVSDDVLRRYLLEKVDLRFLFRDGSKRRYIANWADLDELGWLRLVRADNVSEESYFPRHGFWARHHTAEVGAAAFANDTIASFAIDGAWDASDFSRFYGKFADLYAFLAVTAQGAGTQLSELTLGAVKDIIRSLGWRGGGSYVGFYDKIFSAVDTLNPLRVKRIAYSSPGTIELRGNEEALSDVAMVVDHFGADEGALRTAYGIVYQALGKEDLRTAGPHREFTNSDLRKVVLDNCYAINRGLGVQEPEVLLALCDGNAVVFAKITLSFYRRARELYAFHAEGRVAGQGTEAPGVPTAN